MFTCNIFYGNYLNGYIFLFSGGLRFPATKIWISNREQIQFYGYSNLYSVEANDAEIWVIFQNYIL